MTKIEWTERTWNPIVGCSIASPGCTNCYAMQMAARIERMSPQLEHYKGLTKRVNGKAVWTGKLALAPESTLLLPLRTKKPTMWFVNSMSDLFHEDVPDEWIDRVFAVMALTPQHTYQVLTKRSARMKDYLTRVRDLIQGPQMEIIAEARKLRPKKLYNMTEWPLPNVWLGVSAERQQEADERIPDLLATPAAVRFVSAEPLLGRVDLTRIEIPRVYGSFLFNALTGLGCDHRGDRFPTSLDSTRLDWVIVGGESGPWARPMHPDWARAIRDQCAAAGVPFFFKQWGEWKDCTEGGAIIAEDRIIDRNGKVLGGGHPRGFGMVEEGWEERGGAWLTKVGKKRAGRLLDGREHNDMPRPAHA